MLYANIVIHGGIYYQYQRIYDILLSRQFIKLLFENWDGEHKSIPLWFQSNRVDIDITVDNFDNPQKILYITAWLELPHKPRIRFKFFGVSLALFNELSKLSIYPQRYRQYKQNFLVPHMYLNQWVKNYVPQVVVNQIYKLGDDHYSMVDYQNCEVYSRCAQSYLLN